MLRGESKWQPARNRGIPDRFEGTRPRRLVEERPRPQPLLAQLAPAEHLMSHFHIQE